MPHAFPTSIALQEPGISNGEAASLIAFSSEAVTDANRTGQAGADVALSSAQSAVPGVPEAGAVPQQMEVPLDLPPLSGPQPSSVQEPGPLLQTPAPPPIMQIAAHPGQSCSSLWLLSLLPTLLLDLCKSYKFKALPKCIAIDDLGWNAKPSSLPMPG